MRSTVFGVLLLAFTPALMALDDAKEKPKTPLGAYQELAKEYQKAMDELRKEFQEAKTDEAKQKLYEKYRQNITTSAGRFLELAQKDPKDAAAVEALVWLVENAPASPEAAKAVDLLIKDHLNNDKVKALGPRVTYLPTPAAEKLMRSLLDKADGAEAQAKACNTLAQLMKSKSDIVHMIKGADDELLKQVEVMYGKDFLKEIKTWDADKAAKEAEELFERIVTKYAEAKDLAAKAKTELFELRNLAIGRTAPDIEGEDIDGKKFKLSDYRGKVVVLDFWGNW